MSHKQKRMQPILTDLLGPSSVVARILVESSLRHRVLDADASRLAVNIQARLLSEPVLVISIFTHPSGNEDGAIACNNYKIQTET